MKKWILVHLVSQASLEGHQQKIRVVVAHIVFQGTYIDRILGESRLRLGRMGEGGKINIPD